MMNHSLILQAVYETPWAILPAKLKAILDVAQRHAAGQHMTPELVQALAAQAAARRDASPRSGGAIAIIPVLGTLIPRGDMLLEASGAMSATRIAAMFRQALADPQVGTILLDVDSPGGAVQGIEELAAEIFAARGQKPIVAQANHLAVSAAYWVATAADELVVTPSGEVGSIGVYGLHEQVPNVIEGTEGSVVTFISAGKYKTEGNPFEPLSEEARAALQARIDAKYDAFVKAVARGRGVKAADVRAGFGEGRVVSAREAVRLGMADRIATLDETIQRLARGKAPVRDAAAQAQVADADWDERERDLETAPYVEGMSVDIPAAAALDLHRRRIELHRLRNSPGSEETR